MTSAPIWMVESYPYLCGLALTVSILFVVCLFVDWFKEVRLHNQHLLLESQRRLIEQQTLTGQGYKLAIEQLERQLEARADDLKESQQRREELWQQNQRIEQDYVAYAKLTGGQLQSTQTALQTAHEELQGARGEKITLEVLLAKERSQRAEWDQQNNQMGIDLVRVQASYDKLWAANSQLAVSNADWVRRSESLKATVLEQEQEIADLKKREKHNV